MKYMFVKNPAPVNQIDGGGMRSAAPTLKESLRVSFRCFSGVAGSLAAMRPPFPPAPELATTDAYATAAYAMGTRGRPHWLALERYEGTVILETDVVLSTGGFPHV